MHPLGGFGGGWGLSVMNHPPFQYSIPGIYGRWEIQQQKTKTDEDTDSDTDIELFLTQDNWPKSLVVKSAS